jgi:membrane protein insertase Oxa1/YidC/SpoIIIJ
LIISLQLPAALPLYWLTSSLVAIWQQSIILKEDVTEAGVVANSKIKVTHSTLDNKPKKQKTTTSKKKASAQKRRKK